MCYNKLYKSSLQFIIPFGVIYMYYYETHLHTYPVSRCAKVGVRESLEFYKEIGHDGVFITNHFLGGSININEPMTYEEKINFYFSDYEDALKISKEIGIKVFLGVETSYCGTDFLIYGLDKAWFLAHPEIMEMRKSEELSFFKENGALVIQAHPFREASYIDHLRLYPRSIHGAEIINSCRTELENKMAKLFAENYDLIQFAGSDNHWGKEIASRKGKIAGMCSETPIADEKEFIEAVLNGNMSVFEKVLTD